MVSLAEAPHRKEAKMAHITYDAGKDLGTIKLTSPDIPDSLAILQDIQFQHGSWKAGINGVQNEDILRLLAMRLRDLNSKFPCRENSIAITKVEEALLWLEHRTRIREEQGVEGKNENHVSP
jgi:hypothetical protein